MKRFGVPLGMTVVAGVLVAGGFAQSTGNGVFWFVNGRTAPAVIAATVGRDLAPGPNFVMSVTARHRPAGEPIDGISCLYAGGGLRGGPPRFNDCGNLPGVDICN